MVMGLGIEILISASRWWNTHKCVINWKFENGFSAKLPQKRDFIGVGCISKYVSPLITVAFWKA